MAIAVDATGTKTGGTPGTSFIWSHTCTGSNLILFVGFNYGGAGITATVKYKGVSMTAVSGSPMDMTGGTRLYLFYLVGPATGTNDVEITTSSSIGGVQARSVSYTGVSQTGQPDATNTNSSTGGTTIAVNVTTIADNCWVVGFCNSDTDALSAGSGTTLRNGGANAAHAMFDSGGVVHPAGVKTLNVTCGSTGDLAMIAASFKPVFVTSIKTINGLANASIKTVNGLARASVKSFNGLN